MSLKIRTWATDDLGQPTSWRMLVKARSAEISDYHAEMRRHGYRETTVDKRMSVLIRVEQFLAHDLIESTTVELRAWLDAHKIGPRTLYSYTSHLTSFWKWAIAEERATKDPTAKLTRPKLRAGLPRPVASNDLSILIEQAPNTEIRAMITLAGYAGLRCMEIAQLDSSEVLDRVEKPMLVISNGKGGKQRVVAMAPSVVDALRAHGLPSYGPVFHDADGNAYNPWKVSHLLRQHMHTCGVNASAHQLRHAFATEFYHQTHNLRLTQEMLGHASPATTAIYTQWDIDEASAVVAKLFT